MMVKILFFVQINDNFVLDKMLQDADVVMRAQCWISEIACLFYV